MMNAIDDLIDLSGGNVHKMFNIIGGKQKGKTYTQKITNKPPKNIKQINIKKHK